MSSRTASRLIRSVAAAVIAVSLLIGAAPAASAGPHHTGATAAGTRSLAEVLAADGSGFDRNWADFDILDNAVHAVLAAKPGSPVRVLADGAVALTAFLPTDRAFQVLAFELTRHWYTSEAAVFSALATALGINTIEAVLLYHVVPGATIDFAAALRSNGAVLTTALAGQTVTVRVLSRYFRLIQLRDGNRRAIDPIIIPGKVNLNAGNRQIAHGIAFVLQPAS